MSCHVAANDKRLLILLVNGHDEHIAEKEIACHVTEQITEYINLYAFIQKEFLNVIAQKVYKCITRAMLVVR
jgi:hypothetical protein